MLMNNQLIGFGAGKRLELKASAYIAQAMVYGASFNGTEINALDAFFRKAREDGWDTGWDEFGIVWNNSTAAARVNAFSPGVNDMTAVGSPVFTARAGLVGAVSGYWEAGNMTGFANYQQNSAYMFFDAQGVSAQNVGLIGNANTNRLQPNGDGSGNAQIVNNNYAAGTNYRTGANGNGFHSASRTASTTLSIRKNGVQLGADTGGVASIAVPSGNYKICGGINGNATAAQVCFHGAGAPRSLATEASMIAAIAAFKASF